MTDVQEDQQALTLEQQTTLKNTINNYDLSRPNNASQLLFSSYVGNLPSHHKNVLLSYLPQADKKDLSLLVSGLFIHESINNIASVDSQNLELISKGYKDMVTSHQDIDFDSFLATTSEVQDVIKNTLTLNDYILKGDSFDEEIVSETNGVANRFGFGVRLAPVYNARLQKVLHDVEAVETNLQNILRAYGPVDVLPQPETLYTFTKQVSNEIDGLLEVVPLMPISASNFSDANLSIEYLTHQLQEVFDYNPNNEVKDLESHAKEYATTFKNAKEDLDLAESYSTGMNALATHINDSLVLLNKNKGVALNQNQLVEHVREWEQEGETYASDMESLSTRSEFVEPVNAANMRNQYTQLINRAYSFIHPLLQGAAQGFVSSKMDEYGVKIKAIEQTSN